MLGDNRYNDSPELASLGFMYGDCISQIQILNAFPAVFDIAAFRKKRDDTCQIFIFDFPNCPDVAVKHSKIIIVSSLDHPVAFSENFLPYFKLSFSLPWRIGRFLKLTIQADGA